MGNILNKLFGDRYAIVIIQEMNNMDITYALIKHNSIFACGNNYYFNICGLVQEYNNKTINRSKSKVKFRSPKKSHIKIFRAKNNDAALKKVQNICRDTYNSLERFGCMKCFGSTEDLFMLTPVD